MRSYPAKLALTTLLLSLAVSVQAAEQRWAVYDSPEKAFTAYQAAVEKDDAETAFEALTPQCQETLLFDQWAHEVTGQSRRVLLIPLVDDAKRQAITRQTLPTQRRDLAAVLTGSLADKRAAFAKIMPTLPILRSNGLRNYRVANIKVDGDRATSDLWFRDFESSPGPDKMHFAKDDQGWLVDLRPDEDFLPRGASPEPIQPNDNASRVKLDSPRAAFEAFERARTTLSASAARDACSEQLWNDFLFVQRLQLIGEHGDNVLLHWYGDLLRFAEGDMTNPLPTQQQARAKAFVYTLHDPQILCAAILKRMQELDRSRGRRIVNDLADVTVQGIRARGLVRRSIQPLDKDGKPRGDKKYPFAERYCYFQRAGATWQLDLPTPDERKREPKPQQAAEDATAKRSRTYANPQEVFSACHQARADFDVATLWDCLTPEDRNAVIYWAWAEQFHFQNDAPTLHEVIDEQRRRVLTRERLPVLSEELQPLLLESLTDSRAAFALSLHRFELLGQELDEVKIAKDRATADFVRSQKKSDDDDELGEFDNERRPPDIAFAKDAQGWRIALHSRSEDVPEDPRFRRELTEEDKKVKALKPRNPKPWTGRAAPRYAKPEQVYEAQARAFLENDPETVWHCLTEQKQASFMKENMLMLVEGGGGDLMLAWYSDMPKFEQLRHVHERKSRPLWAKVEELEEEAEGEETSERDRQHERTMYETKLDGDRFGANCYYDPQTYFSAIVKRYDLDNRRQFIRHPDQKPRKLDKVIIKGNRAHGIRTETGVARAVQITDEGDKEVWSDESSFEVTGYFANVDGSWQLDVPTLEEHMAEWEKYEEDARKSREEARRER